MNVDKEIEERKIMLRIKLLLRVSPLFNFYLSTILKYGKNLNFMMKTK